MHTCKYGELRTQAVVNTMCGYRLNLIKLPYLLKYKEVFEEGGRWLWWLLRWLQPWPGLGVRGAVTALPPPPAPVISTPPRPMPLPLLHAASTHPHFRPPPPPHTYTDCLTSPHPRHTPPCCLLWVTTLGLAPAWGTTHAGFSPYPAMSLWFQQQLWPWLWSQDQSNCCHSCCYFLTEWGQCQHMLHAPGWSRVQPGTATQDKQQQEEEEWEGRASGRRGRHQGAQSWWDKHRGEQTQGGGQVA